MADWTYTDISHGHCTVTNGDITVKVRDDFSGSLESESGDYFEFKDLRAFIDGAKLLEKVLTEHYGGYR